MKVGILGGTFNPIHLGHLLITQVISERFNLDRLVFIPCYLPYHKKNTGLVESKHRLNMVRSAISRDSLFEVSDIDIRRGGPSYSFDTVMELKKRFPRGAGFYFIVGSDNIPELAGWYRIKELGRLCRFVVVPRPGYPVSLNKSRRLGIKTLYYPGPLLDISSSRIRQRVKEGKTIKYFVPEAVAQYIKRYRLYR